MQGRAGGWARATGHHALRGAGRGLATRGVMGKAGAGPVLGGRGRSPHLKGPGPAFSLPRAAPGLASPAGSGRGRQSPILRRARFLPASPEAVRAGAGGPASARSLMTQNYVRRADANEALSKRQGGGGVMLAGAPPPGAGPQVVGGDSGPPGRGGARRERGVASRLARLRRACGWLLPGLPAALAACLALGPWCSRIRRRPTRRLRHRWRGTQIQRGLEAQTSRSQNRGKFFLFF